MAALLTSILIFPMHQTSRATPRGDIPLGLVLISRRPTCDVVAGCNRQRSAICPSGSPADLRWIADVLKFARNSTRTAQFSIVLPANMD